MSIYCERCQAKLTEKTVRYLVTIHATADVDEHLPDEGGIDDLEAVMRMIDKKTEEEHDHDVYESKAFTLCPVCKNAFMKNPLNNPPTPLVGGNGEKEGRVH